MHLVHTLINHVRAKAHQLIDDASDRLFISGDRRRADDNEIVGRNRHLAVIVRRHARKRAHRLPLAARRDQHDIFGAVAVDIVDIDHNAVGRLEIPKLR